MQKTVRFQQVQQKKGRGLNPTRLGVSILPAHVKPQPIHAMTGSNMEENLRESDRDN